MVWKWQLHQNPVHRLVQVQASNDFHQLVFGGGLRQVHCLRRDSDVLRGLIESRLIRSSSNVCSYVITFILLFT